MMHISNVSEADVVRLVVTRQLKDSGIKLPRKLSTPLPKPLGVGQPDKQLGLPLVSKHFKRKAHLPHGTVKIPIILHDSSAFLLSHLHTEGLFRKTGSLSRQRELVSRMDRGLAIPDTSHAHDVASVMKRFFRELPEPLLTNRLMPCFEEAYEMFHDDKEKFHGIVALLCLLLPRDHRHTLEWTMRFMSSVAAKSTHNRMDANNLATVLAPNVMRCTKIAVPTKRQLRAYTAVVVTLIEINELIGSIPCELHDRVTRLSLHRCRNDREGKDGLVGVAQADGLSEVDGEKSLEDLGAKEKRRKRRSGSISAFISGIGQSLGRLTGSRRSGKRRMSRTTAMEIHDRLAYSDNMLADGYASPRTEDTEDREDDPMDIDSPTPLQRQAVPILDGRMMKKAMPSVNTDGPRRVAAVVNKEHIVVNSRSPVKRKAPEEPVLFSASKRQAILRGSVLPSVVAGGCKTGSQLARLKMASGRMTVTPARLRSCRLLLRKNAEDEKEKSVSPLVREVEKGSEVTVTDDCNSMECCQSTAVSVPSMSVTDNEVKVAKKPKKRRSGLFKVRDEETRESQDGLTGKENSQMDRSHSKTPSSVTKRRPSLSQRLKRLSESMFRSPARLIKAKSEENIVSDQLTQEIGARLSGAALSLGDSEGEEVDHPDFRQGSTIRRKILNDLKSPDMLDGRGPRRRSMSCQNLLSSTSPVVHSVKEWII